MSRRSTTTMVSAALVALVLAAPATGQQRGQGSGRTVEVRVIEHDEFRWADAAIGALAGFGLAVLCAGLIIATERKKRSTS